MCKLAPCSLLSVLSPSCFCSNVAFSERPLQVILFRTQFHIILFHPCAILHMHIACTQTSVLLPGVIFFSIGFAANVYLVTLCAISRSQLECGTPCSQEPISYSCPVVSPVPLIVSDHGGSMQQISGEQMKECVALNHNLKTDRLGRNRL